ncbi:MAG: hypothetical protein GY826_37810 [Fuerstiella sp.]|nr:hypothetical protein [Fuerstiella sp.]
MNPPHDGGVWCTVPTAPYVSSAPSLRWPNAFEATGVPQKWTFEAWLPRGQMFEIRPDDGTLRLAGFPEVRSGPARKRLRISQDRPCIRSRCNGFTMDLAMSQFVTDCRAI